MTTRVPIGPRLFLSHLRAATGLALGAAPATAVSYLVLAIVSGLVPVGAAWLIRALFDLIAGPGPVPVAEVVTLAVAVALLGLGAAVLPELRGYLQGQLGRTIAVVATDRLHRAAGRLVGLGRIEDPAFRDEFRMAQQAGRSGPGQVVEDVVGAAQAAVTLIGFLGTLLLLSPAFAGIVLVGAAPALIAQLRLSRAGAQLVREMMSRARREMHYADLLTSVPAAKELRLLSLGDLFRGRMLTELAAVNSAETRHGRQRLATQGALMVLGAIVSGAGLIWAVAAAAQGRLTIGDVSIFIAAMASVQMGVQGIVERIGTAHRAMLLFHHYRAIEATPPDLPQSRRDEPLPPLRRGIELVDVWFRYRDDKPWVLKGVNLFIPYGQATALVGLNGAGKSTLIKLLCRFYDPTRGRITWDGIDLRDVPVDELRDRIGAVFQDYMHYEISAAENVGVGDVAWLDDRSRVIAAARRAGAHDMLSALPRGYDTLLTTSFFDEADKNNPETGVLLSGGQSQRVALARAFMRDQRDLMILDEPSAGLDPEAEYQVHSRLRRHRDGATSILISHRLNTVRDADHIAVLAQGRVAEQGTHDHLMTANGDYANLFRLQSKGYLPEASTVDTR